MELSELRNIWYRECPKAEDKQRQLHHHATHHGIVSRRPQMPGSVRALVDLAYTHDDPEVHCPSKYPIRSLANLPFSAVWHVVRVAFGLALAPLIILGAIRHHYSFSEMGRAKLKENVAWYRAKNIGHEILDICAIALCVIVALVNFLLPRVVLTNRLERYYLERMKDQDEFESSLKLAGEASGVR